MDTKTYLESRVQNQIEYFNTKSATCKKKHQWLQVISIICSLAVPLLVGYVTQHDWLKYVVGAFGAVVALAESLQALYKFKENWLSYRSTAESLIRERFLFETKAGQYAKATDAYPSFVEQVENILAAENRIWLQHTKTEKKE
jgi:hypothetical protein